MTILRSRTLTHELLRNRSVTTFGLEKEILKMSKRIMTQEVREIFEIKDIILKIENAYLTILVDGALRKMRIIWVGSDVLLNHSGTNWKLPLLQYADDAIPVVESEEELARTVGRSDGICRRRKLRVNENKSKIVFEREGMPQCNMV